MTDSITVYPREGTTYPDAAGVPITSAGAIVDYSTYIDRAIRKHFLFEWDPLGIYQPDDRRSNGGGTSGEGGLTFATVADMVAVTGTPGLSCVVEGYHEPGDGGGGNFFWDHGNVSTSDNGITFGSGSVGRWVRLFSFPIHTRWFGAKGDGVTDDTAAIQAWIDSVGWGESAYSDPGRYRITAPLAIQTHHATFDGPQTAANPDAKGFTLDWDGAASYFSGEDWAVYVTGISTHIKGWNVRASKDLWGAFHAGQMNWSSIINTRCHFVDCVVDASEFPDQPIINYGFGVGAHWQSVGRGNQDFNYFENCTARNCYLWGWIVHGGANTIQTTLRRCAILNIMGIPNGRKYIEKGLSDGDYHTYGGGILSYDNGGIDADGINFAYLETGFARMNPVTQGASYATNDRLVNFDCELTKKLCKVRTSGKSGTLTLENGRFAHPRLYQAGLGPYEWPDDDYKHIDVDGPSCRIAGLSYAIDDDDRFDGCVYMGSQGGILQNCALPSERPFVGEATTYACFGSVGAGGVLAKIPDGTFTWLDDGSAVAPPAAIAQKYIALLGSKLWDMWSADYGVEVNTSGEVLGWTSAVLGIRTSPVSSANRPTFAADGSNFRGKHVVHTDAATSKGLAGTANSQQAALGGNTGSNVWSISVFRLKTLPGAGADASFTVLDCGTALSNDVHILEFDRISNVNTLRYKLNNGSPVVVDANSPDTNQHAYVCSSNGTNMYIQRDSTSATTQATLVGTNTGVRGVGIGRRIGTAINYSECAHALHLICHEPPTSGELASLLQLIASDWSIV